MRVRLVAFATASDILGRETLSFDLEGEARLSDLRKRAESEHPALSDLWPRVAVAVDGELAKDDPLLRDGVEVALLPPVSGG